MTSPQWRTHLSSDFFAYLIKNIVDVFELSLESVFDFLRLFFPAQS